MDTLKKIQACEIDILSKIDAICKKHNLEYFGIGGTALGAVRHQGFIPWDDDIDIGMPRADYQRFLEVAAEELPEGYHIQNFRTEPKTPFYFTKIRKDGTKFVEYYLKDHKIHHGIFVDVFPFDNIPDGKWAEKIHFRCTRILYQLYLSKTLNTMFSSRLEQIGEGKKSYKYYVRKILHLLLTPVPKKWIYSWLNGCSQLYNKRETLRMGHVARKRLMVSRQMLYPICELEFEDIHMPVPKDYDGYLKNQFGDYMVLPPEEKKYGHLPYEVEV